MENNKNLDDEKKYNEEEEEKQEKVGKEIDEHIKYQRWLKENKEILSNPKYILYRLPLTHEQREIVYNNLMKEAKELENKN